jgi:hypothetical protein
LDSAVEYDDNQDCTPPDSSKKSKIAEVIRGLHLVVLGVKPGLYTRVSNCGNNTTVHGLVEIPLAFCCIVLHAYAATCYVSESRTHA